MGKEPKVPRCFVCGRSEMKVADIIGPIRHIEPLTCKHGHRMVNRSGYYVYTCRSCRERGDVWVEDSDEAH